MSDERALHDHAHDQSWTGGLKARPDTQAEALASQGLQDALQDERAAGYEAIGLGAPPLLEASPERLELCEEALMFVLLGAGIPITRASELARRCAERLKEPLE